MLLSILLVEDNPDHAILLKKTLERDPQIGRVEICIDAHAALACLGESGRFPDLVVTDHRLPGFSGLDLLDRIKLNPATEPIPVVLVSSAVRESEISECLEHGAAAFLLKPVRAQSLINIVQEQSRVAAKSPTSLDRDNGRPERLGSDDEQLLSAEPGVGEIEERPSDR